MKCWLTMDLRIYIADQKTQSFLDKWTYFASKFQRDISILFKRRELHNHKFKKQNRNIYLSSLSSIFIASGNVVVKNIYQRTIKTTTMQDGCTLSISYILRSALIQNGSINFDISNGVPCSLNFSPIYSCFVNIVLSYIPISSSFREMIFFLQ